MTPPRYVRLYRGRNWHRLTDGHDFTYCGESIGNHYTVFDSPKLPTCKKCEERNQAEIETIAFAEKLKREESPMKTQPTARPWHYDPTCPVVTVVSNDE